LYNRITKYLLCFKRLTNIDNRNSEELAFLSGVLDITMSLPFEKVSAYKMDARLRVDPALQVECVLVNTKRAPFDHAEVRRAFSMALDRISLCKDILRGGQTPAYRLVPPDCGADYAENNDDNGNTLCDDAPLKAISGLSENPRKARELLGGITFVKNPVYCFNSSGARKTLAETLQGQWKRNLGADVELRNLEWKTFLRAKSDGDFILCRAGWSADVDDPSSFLELFMSGNHNNMTGWKNPEYDRLVAERKFSQAEEILLKELPCIPLYFNPNVYLISPRVQGWEANPLDRHDWRKVRVE